MVSLDTSASVGHGSVASAHGEYTHHRGVKKNDGNEAAQPQAPFAVPIAGNFATLAPLGTWLLGGQIRQHTGDAQCTAGVGHGHRGQPRTIPIYNEYTGTTDATETAEIRARVDGYTDQ